jgi:hypothetical protein
VSDRERDDCRKIQDAFLGRAEVRLAIEEKGWDAPVAWSDCSPTYAEVRDLIHPAWVPWMADYLGGG